MALSKKQFLGLGIEAISGTALVTPTVYHPCKSIMKATKKMVEIDDERASRDGPYGIVDTVRSGATDPKGNWYNDTSPYFLIGAMGGVTTASPDNSGAPTVHKHTMNLTDTPKSLTIFKSYDVATYVGAYAAVEKFDLKFSTEGKLLENDVTLKHLYPVKYAGTTLTPTFSNIQPFTGYSPTLTFTGVQSLDVDDMSISFSQKVTEWYPASGVPDFTTLYFGERKVTISFTARFDNDTLYNKYFQSPRVDDSLTVDFKGPVIIVDGATTYYQELSLSFPVISYDSMDHDTGKDNILIKAKATAVASGAGLMSAFVQNTVASYTM